MLKKLKTKQFWLEDWGVLILVLVPVELFIAWAYWPFVKASQPKPCTECRCKQNG